MEKEKNIVNWGHEFLYNIEKYQQLTVSVSDRKSCTILRCRWCNIIISSAHAKREEKSDDFYARFYADLKQVFDHFPMYNIEFLLGYFNAKLGRGDICKPTRGMDDNDHDAR